MTELTVVALAEEMSRAIPLLPAHVAIAHGFGHMLDDEGAPARRRAQARTVLLAQHLLAESIADSRSRIVLMKGLEVAALYRSVCERPFRDVDVLTTDSYALWKLCKDRGYEHRPRDRADIGHHHHPPLLAPFGRIGLDVHERPNLPGWARIDTNLIMETAEPSRTGIEGIFRPRDDLHALLMALHAWKAGFTRYRDLYDAVLLGATSVRPVEVAARQLGLERAWRLTLRVAEDTILSRTTIDPLLARIVLPSRPGTKDRRRVRLLAPFLVASPNKVVRSHYREFRIGRAARTRVTELC